MRTVIIVGSLITSLLGVLASAGGVAAQERPSGLLNSLEVQQLVARAEPADHARLRAHFAALADRYTAEAARHTAMARSFGGNPNRGYGSGMSTHCRRLAELNTQSATTVRELADYHATLAGGGEAALPRGAGTFQAGAGAPAPTDAELDALAAKASTPAEHRALEEYFLALAKRYTAEAGNHSRLAQTYRGTRIAQAAVHHDRLARLATDAAREATEAASLHKGLAAIR